MTTAISILVGFHAHVICFNSMSHLFLSAFCYHTLLTISEGSKHFIRHMICIWQSQNCYQQNLVHDSIPNSSLIKSPVPAQFPVALIHSRIIILANSKSTAEGINILSMNASCTDITASAYNSLTRVFIFLPCNLLHDTCRLLRQCIQTETSHHQILDTY